MTDQGPSATRTVRDVHGQPVELQWEIQVPQRWWHWWRGQINYRYPPTEEAHFGTMWMEDLSEPRALTKRGLAKKLRHREEVLLGRTERPRLWTDGEDVWPG